MKVKTSHLVILFFAVLLSFTGGVKASTFMSFDFDNGEVEKGFDNWWYSPLGDTSCLIYNAAAQSKMCSTPDDEGKVRSFYYYYNGYNSDHMGWMRWGYLDAGDVAISGNSLKLVFTGGIYDNNGQLAESGKLIRSKEQHDAFIKNNINPYADRDLPGGLTLYFKTGGTHHPFQELVGKDRLSVWVLPPEESPYTLERQKYSLAYRRPQNLFSWYPFVDYSNGDHYYHELANINMGGWIHLKFDAHPVHNNSGDKNPYSYYRVGGSDYPGDGVKYFDNVHGFGLRATIMNNLPSPVVLYVDELEAYKETQPENDETIAGIGVGFDPSEKIFDISFNDKYRCSECSATYEVRYAFSPITNANYGSATLCEVINFDRSKNNTQGIIYKPANGYSQIWAALKVRAEDRAELVENKTIYFAVKDLSDRSHLTQRDTYELATVPVAGLGNIRRVDLIKTIDYTIFPIFKKLLFRDDELASGHTGEKYLEHIETKGGIKPLIFELESGSLPAGLTLAEDGLISGTPQRTGTSTFRIKLSESSSFKQVIQKEFSITIYPPEDCTDLRDNDGDSLVDCADPGCYDHSRCSTLLVDFGNPHRFGLSNWQTLLKDTYTDVVASGPAGMTNVVGENAAYNYQGVSGASRSFSPGDKIVVFWYNNGDEPITFTPKISFEDNDRPGSGNSGGSWHFMTEVRVEPGKSEVSLFEFNKTTAGWYSLVNVNVNHNNHKILLCDKIHQQITDAIVIPEGRGKVLGFLPIFLDSDEKEKLKKVF